MFLRYSEALLLNKVAGTERNIEGGRQHDLKSNIINLMRDN